MPILDVEVVGELPDRVGQGLAPRIADAASRVLDSPPQSTWVKIRFLPADHYAENEGGPPAGTEPVLVSVLQADPPRGDDLAALAERLTAAIAGACERSVDGVHLIFEPPAAGRVAFGGRLRR
jgi:phenylpyruvate tautomerase PptA (4-oxalocrotonate tautomerase family)